LADHLKLPYLFILSWISLTVLLSAEAVGLTAAFSTAHWQKRISCDAVAAFYNDHIFVDYNDATKAMEILNNFSNSF
jgi:hypothetical protein